MPPIAWIAAAYAAGLLTGYAPVARESALGATTAVVALLAWLALEERIPAAVPFLFAAGALVALAAPVRATRFAPPVVDTSSFAGRERHRATVAIDRAFGDDAPLARALLVADQGEIPPDIKHAYADAGIVHMLSISGMHVALIAMAIGLVLRAARLSVTAAALGTVGIIALYVYVIGAPPPAVRSAVMLTVVAAGRARQRNVSRWGVLALGALAPITAPATVLDVGYQLSVAGMAGLFASRALVRRTFLRTLDGWRGAIARGIAASVVATLVTAPLVAGSFGRLSLVAPLTNLVADPILALAQPMLFLALVLAPLPPAAALVAGAAHPLLVAFDTVARVAARTPGAALAVHLSPMARTLTGVAAVAGVVACESRHPGRAAAVALACVALALWAG
jgi:competence protein ComEC